MAGGTHLDAMYRLSGNVMSVIRAFETDFGIRRIGIQISLEMRKPR